MKFDDLDTKMRVFETAHDHCVLPGLWMVTAERRRIIRDMERPMRDEYDRFIRNMLIRSVSRKLLTIFCKEPEVQRSGTSG